ncbi:hypothetical protein TWF718_005002 [Orbilia javanica]|uniref:Oxidoreductase acuF-like C2H2 type zinc-finger domain-containing protein n=1 Tax=Orbilia javanica TaxID=47235 RepID=A0AAN8MYD1_9PEZI
MVGITGSTRTLNELGLETRELFANVIRVFENDASRDATIRALLSAEADRFGLWAVSLGLFVPGHGSLDYRVREAENIRNVIKGFLEALNDSLSEAIDYLSPEDRNQGPRDSQNDSAVCLSESDSEDGWWDESSHDDASDLVMMVDGIKDPIDRLYKLSIWIRNPSTRLNSSKFLSHKHIDEETGVDLLQAFTSLDFNYIESVFAQYRKSKIREENNGDAISEDEEKPRQAELFSDHIDPSIAPSELYLVQRLAHANGRRRQQFSYWKRHREKLALHTGSIGVPSVRKEHHPVPKEAYHQRHDNGAWEFDQAINLNPISVTTATRLNIPQYSAINDAISIVSVSKYAPSNWSPGNESLAFPAPPKHSQDQKFFECPFCFTLCPGTTLQNEAWKAHLIRDLRPYICTYEDCKTPNQLYDTRRDWLQHEGSTHRRVFLCPEHPYRDFLSLSEYQEHIKDGHLSAGGSIPTELIIQSNESTLIIPDRPCPICLVWIENMEALQKHIALHLERFAIFSLPRHVCDDHDADLGSNDADGNWEWSRNEDFTDDLAIMSASHASSTYGQTVSSDGIWGGDLYWDDPENLPDNMRTVGTVAEEEIIPDYKYPDLPASAPTRPDSHSSEGWESAEDDDDDGDNEEYEDEHLAWGEMEDVPEHSNEPSEHEGLSFNSGGSISEDESGHLKVPHRTLHRKKDSRPTHGPDGQDDEKPQTSPRLHPQDSSLPVFSLNALNFVDINDFTSTLWAKFEHLFLYAYGTDSIDPVLSIARAAIYHRSIKQIYFIWTAKKLTEPIRARATTLEEVIPSLTKTSLHETDEPTASSSLLQRWTIKDTISTVLHRGPPDLKDLFSDFLKGVSTGERCAMISHDVHSSVLDDLIETTPMEWPLVRAQVDAYTLDQLDPGTGTKTRNDLFAYRGIDTGTPQEKRAHKREMVARVSAATDRLKAETARLKAKSLLAKKEAHPEPEGDPYTQPLDQISRMDSTVKRDKLEVVPTIPGTIKSRAELEAELEIAIRHESIARARARFGPEKDVDMFYGTKEDTRHNSAISSLSIQDIRAEIELANERTHQLMLMEQSGYYEPGVEGAGSQNYEGFLINPNPPSMAGSSIHAGRFAKSPSGEARVGKIRERMFAERRREREMEEKRLE